MASCSGPAFSLSRTVIRGEKKVFFSPWVDSNAYYPVYYEKAIKLDFTIS